MKIILCPSLSFTLRPKVISQKWQFENLSKKIKKYLMAKEAKQIFLDAAWLSNQLRRKIFFHPKIPLGWGRQLTIIKTFLPFIPYRRSGGQTMVLVMSVITTFHSGRLPTSWELQERILWWVWKKVLERSSLSQMFKKTCHKLLGVISASHQSSVST